MYGMFGALEFMLPKTTTVEATAINKRRVVGFSAAGVQMHAVLWTF